MLRHFTNMYMPCRFIIGVICGASFIFCPTAVVATGPANSQFLAREHLIIDCEVALNGCAVRSACNGMGHAVMVKS